LPEDLQNLICGMVDLHEVTDIVGWQEAGSRAISEFTIAARMAIAANVRHTLFGSADLGCPIVGQLSSLGCVLIVSVAKYRCCKRPPVRMLKGIANDGAR
jgi:hypothetical protein